MAKRFIDTNLFDDPWFFDLSKEAKVFWIYYITKCDHAGVLKQNIELLEFILQEKDIKRVLKEVSDKVFYVNSLTLFCPDFLLFQYPDFPKSNVRQQASAIKILSGLKIFSEKSEKFILDNQGITELPESYIEVRNQLFNSYPNSLGNSYPNSLGNSLGKSITNSLGNSLDNSLGNSLGKSIGNSLANSYPNSYVYIHSIDNIDNDNNIQCIGVGVKGEGGIPTNMENLGNAQKSEVGPEKKIKTPKSFSPPKVEEVVEFFLSKGFSSNLAQRAFEYYDSANWVDGKGSKVINWKQKMLAVWLREENREQKKSGFADQTIDPRFNP